MACHRYVPGPELQRCDACGVFDRDEDAEAAAAAMLIAYHLGRWFLIKPGAGRWTSEQPPPVAPYHIELLVTGAAG